MTVLKLVGALAVDADLRRQTLDAISAHAKQPLAGGIVDVYDTRQPGLQVWEGRNGVLPFLTALEDAVAEGPVAVATDSLTFARRVEALFAHKRVLIVSSEHGKPEAEELRRRVAEADVVVWTPTIRASVSLHGGGIDDRFAVFGFFVGGRPQSAFQSLGRIRRPKDPVWRVWVGWRPRPLAHSWDRTTATGRGWGPGLDLLLDCRESRHWWSEVRARRLLVVKGAGLARDRLKPASERWHIAKIRAWKTRMAEIEAAYAPHDRAGRGAPVSPIEALRIAADEMWGPNADLRRLMPAHPDDERELRKEGHDDEIEWLKAETRLYQAKFTAQVIDAWRRRGKPAPLLVRAQQASVDHAGPKAKRYADAVEQVVEALRAAKIEDPWAAGVDVNRVRGEFGAVEMPNGIARTAANVMRLASVGDPAAPVEVGGLVAAYALSRILRWERRAS